MAKEKPAEKGRNAESATVQAAMPQQPANPIIITEAEEIPNPNEYGNDKLANYPSGVIQPKQPDLSAMTYEQDPNGNIVAGKNVGAAPGTTLATQESQMAEQMEAQRLPQAATVTEQPQTVQPSTVQPGIAQPTQEHPTTAQPGAQVVNPATGEQPAATTTVAPNYKYDWGSGLSMLDAYNQGLHSQAEIMEDRRLWGKENNKPINYFEAAMLFPRDHDITKTKTQNEDDIKRAARKEKMDQIGNFLSHLGNFIGTAGFGGLDVKPEDPVKFTERQRQLKEKSKALRDAYYKDFFANLAKQQAEDRAIELNNANIAYRNQQAQTSQREAERKAKESESKLQTEAAQREKIAAETALTKQRTETEKNKPVKTTGSSSRGRTRSGGGSTKTEKMYKEFDDNLANHPDLAEQFMKENNIGGRSGKQWNTITMQRFNQYVKRNPKTAATRTKVNY